MSKRKSTVTAKSEGAGIGTIAVVGGLGLLGYLLIKGGKLEMPSLPSMPSMSQISMPNIAEWWSERMGEWQSPIGQDEKPKSECPGTSRYYADDRGTEDTGKQETWWGQGYRETPAAELPPDVQREIKMTVPQWTSPISGKEYRTYPLTFPHLSFGEQLMAAFNLGNPIGWLINTIKYGSPVAGIEQVGGQEAVAESEQTGGGYPSWLSPILSWIIPPKVGAESDIESIPVKANTPSAPTLHYGGDIHAGYKSGAGQTSTPKPVTVGGGAAVSKPPDSYIL